MQLFTLILFSIAGIVSLADAENDPRSVFLADLKHARAKYRTAQSEIIRTADRVVMYLVDFEITPTKDPFNNDDKTITISPNTSFTRILATKEVSQEHKVMVLDALATQIAKPEHHGGALCHFPIHGIRVYHGEQLLHEGTFCWLCGNFSFSYPTESDLLDTSEELERIFMALLPIPQQELDRFYQKYPQAKFKTGLDDR